MMPGRHGWRENRRTTRCRGLLDPPAKHVDSYNKGITTARN